MKNILIVGLLLLVAVACVYWFGDKEEDVIVPIAEKTMKQTEDVVQNAQAPTIIPISHATLVLDWDDVVLYVDPVGGTGAFAGQKPADVVLVTDIHGDHLNVETLQAVVGTETTLIVPQAVADELPAEMASHATILANGEVIVDDVHRLSIEAVPMYNLPEQALERVYHEKGRGNGYVLERGGERVYIAGDTADTPEMRALTDIDIAFIPMNLPYTMSVEDAAAGVIAFKPKRVYPYHYRTPDGLADVAAFANLVQAGAPEVEVVQLEWYP